MESCINRALYWLSNHISGDIQIMLLPKIQLGLDQLRPNVYRFIQFKFEEI